MPRPAYVTEEHLTYLDYLRESGATNMYAAAQWLVDEFWDEQLGLRDAQSILAYWMETFGERHGTS